MKKNVLFALTGIVLSGCVQAQIAKGSIFTGVDANYSSTVNSFSSSPAATSYATPLSQNSFSFTPGIGYFVAEDFVLGLNIGYTNSWERVGNTYVTPPSSPPSTVTIMNGLSVTPYGRRYFNLGEKAAIFMQLNVGYTKTWGSYEPTGSSGPNDELNNGYVFSVSLTPGLSYFISNKFELEAGIAILGYTVTSTTSSQRNSTDTQTVNNSNFGLNLSMSAINFGFKYYLRKSE